MLSLKNLQSGKGGGASAVAKYCKHAAEKSVGYYPGDGAPSSWHGAVVRTVMIRRSNPITNWSDKP